MQTHGKVSIIGSAIVWIAMWASPAWGQSAWPGYPNNSTISVTSAGRVGVRTTAPLGELTVYSTDDANPRRGISVMHDSNGVQAPLHYFVKARPGGTPLVGDWAGATYYALKNASGNIVDLGAFGFQVDNNAAGSETGSCYFATATGSSALAWRMVIRSNGRVGTGTTNPQHLLSVNGVVGAKDVIVTNSGWSDYVFKPGYELLPLSKVDQFIQEHRHLPDIPSEAEVKAQGVSVGEMQAKLLAKIEELTLHLIRQEKENRELRERVQKLESRAAER